MSPLRRWNRFPLRFDHLESRACPALPGALTAAPAVAAVLSAPAPAVAHTTAVTSPVTTAVANVATVPTVSHAVTADLGLKVSAPGLVKADVGVSAAP